MPPRSPHGVGFARRIAQVMTVATATITYLIGSFVGGGGVAHAAEPTLSASTATGTQIVLGQPILITIAARSDTLISGTMVVSSDNSAPAEYDIEVPAGTTKELTVVGSALQYQQEGYSITWFDDDGKRVATTTMRSALKGGDTVVGVFPSMGTDFPARINQPTGTDSYLFTIPEKQLELPVAAFAQYDVIVGGIDDIKNFDGDRLIALQTWLAHGGRLVIDDGEEAAVADVLGMKEPGDHFGDGQILLTSDTLRPDGWAQATLPVPARSAPNLGPMAWVGGGGSIGMQTLPQGLVKYSGDPIIGSLWLLLLVVLYAVIVGPLMFVALRRRRRTLWVIGPVIAVVACSLIWLDSARRRSNIQDAHGTVISVTDVASEVRSAEMLYVRSNEPVGITLPPTYSLGFTYDDWSPEKVAPGPDGTRVSQAAEVGSFVVYNGNGPASQFDDQLTGTVTIDDDTASGTITNRLDVDLHQVAVMWNGKAKNIGDVPAGETVEYSLGKKDRVTENAALTVWGDAFIGSGWWGMTAPTPSGKPRPELVSPAVWDLALNNDPTVGLSQSVDVAGWTDGLDSPITGSSRGVSAVIARVEPEQASTDGETSVIYATDAMNAQNWAADALIRLDAPAETTGVDLALKLSRAFQTPQLLVDGEWLKLVPAGAASYVIPADALDDRGGIYLRTEINLDQAQMGGFNLPHLHPVGADEKTVPMVGVPADSTTDQTGEGPGATATTVPMNTDPMNTSPTNTGSTTVAPATTGPATTGPATAGPTTTGPVPPPVSLPSEGGS